MIPRKKKLNVYFKESIVSNIQKLKSKHTRSTKQPDSSKFILKNRNLNSYWTDRIIKHRIISSKARRRNQRNKRLKCSSIKQQWLNHNKSKFLSLNKHELEILSFILIAAYVFAKLKLTFIIPLEFSSYKYWQCDLVVDTKWIISSLNLSINDKRISIFYDAINAKR